MSECLKVRGRPGERESGWNGGRETGQYCVVLTSSEVESFGL